MAQTQHHFLIVTYPVQGHINPALEFAKRLIQLGVKVTFTITVSAYRKMNKADGRVPECFDFVVFSDGFDDGFNFNTDYMLFLKELKRHGSESLKKTISFNAGNGTPVTCLVYTLLLPWAAEVARGADLPAALLWVQPASILRMYYYYFNGYDKLIRDCRNDPSWSIDLPGLPSLKSCDLPSLCLPSNPYEFILDSFKEQLDTVASEEKPIILVNSFNALEKDALKEIDGKVSPIAIGPLIPSDISFGGDLMFKTSKDDYIMEWMNTKPRESIVYIAFGSIIVLTNKQKDAIAQGLLQSGRPFLWVIRDADANLKGEENKEKQSCMEELEQLGLIVPWCSQLEVLLHPSLGCFVTHCGWNSTLETIVCGVPVVAFPHWNDQPMNAKLLEDVWETGVRVTPNEDGVVEGEEIRKCIEMVMADDEKGVAMRNNAKKWKYLAGAAVKETGSSDTNLKSFIQSLNIT